MADKAQPKQEGKLTYEELQAHLNTANTLLTYMVDLAGGDVLIPITELDKLAQEQKATFVSVSPEKTMIRVKVDKPHLRHKPKEIVQ